MLLGACPHAERSRFGYCGEFYLARNQEPGSLDEQQTSPTETGSSADASYRESSVSSLASTSSKILSRASSISEGGSSAGELKKASLKKRAFFRISLIYTRLIQNIHNLAVTIIQAIGLGKDAKKWAWLNKVELDNAASANLQGELYVGGIPLANDLGGVNYIDEIKKLADGKKIVIISVNEKWELDFTPTKDPALFGQNWEHHVVECEDYKPIPVENFQKAAETIDKAIKEGNFVYVHCKAGKGRSTACIAAYLMYKESQASEEKRAPAEEESKQSLDAAAAIDKVKASRPQLKLGKEQRGALQNYHSSLFGARTNSLVAT